MKHVFRDLPHLLENTFVRKRIYANPNPSNPNAQCFRIGEVTSFFEQVYTTVRSPGRMVGIHHPNNLKILVMEKNRQKLVI